MTTNKERYVTQEILTYYDSKIKNYIEDKVKEPKDELSEVERRVDAVETASAVNAANIASNREDIDELEIATRAIQETLADVRVALENKVESSDLDKYLTKELAESTYYTKEQVADKIQEAIDLIPEVDTSNLVTRDELDKTLDDFATESELNGLKDEVVEVQASLEEKADKSDIKGLATQEFVLAKIAEAELSGGDIDLSSYYTKSEVDALIPDVSNFVNKEDFEKVQQQSASNDVKIMMLDEELIGVKQNIETLATKEELKEAIESIEHPTIDLEGYATEEYVDNRISEIKLPEPELFVVDYNSPNFADAIAAYSSGKLLILTNAAPDINSYAVMNYVRDDMITFTKFLMSRSNTYGAFNTYYLHSDNTWEVAKEVKLNKVEAKVDDNQNISELVIGKDTYDFDNFATTENITQLTQSIENIENNYVSNTYITENYTTKEELEATYVTTEKVTEQIETIVTEVIQEKVDSGEIQVSAESITYDTWD